MTTAEMAVAVTVRMVTEHMTDLELACINNAVCCEFDPGGIEGYEKARPLFTERGGTRMHAMTKAAYQREVSRRLGRGVDG